MREGRGEGYRREDQTVPPCHFNQGKLKLKKNPLKNNHITTNFYEGVAVWTCTHFTNSCIWKGHIPWKDILTTFLFKRSQKIAMQIYLDSTICTIACNFIATHMETYLQPFNAYFFRMDYGYKLSCLLGFSINLLPIGHSGVHIGEEHLQCSWCCWTWFSCLTGISLLVDWLVYWYWLVDWLVLVC